MVLEETFDVGLLEEVVEEVEEVEPSDDILSSSVQISPGNKTLRRLWKLMIDSEIFCHELAKHHCILQLIDETYLEFT